MSAATIGWGVGSYDRENFYRVLPHCRGFAHGDLKPANILLLDSERLEATRYTSAAACCQLSLSLNRSSWQTLAIPKLWMTPSLLILLAPPYTWRQSSLQRRCAKAFSCQSHDLVQSRPWMCAPQIFGPLECHSPGLRTRVETIIPGVEC